MSADSEETKFIKLNNGLTVILEQNHSVPIVSVNIGVGVGSAWEAPYEAGLSHLLEHMVFKGTKSYAPGEIAKIVEGSGGELNAYTSLDQTVYYINLSSAHSARALNLLSEMMFLAEINPKELEREKEVVLEEIRRGKDSPSKEATEALFKLAYTVHPYGRPVIGYESMVKNFSRDEVTAFYKRWYVPANMVLVVCGDFNEEEMRGMIDKEFGLTLGSAPERSLLPLEPLPARERFKKLTRAVQGNYLYLSFPIPSFTHPDIPLLDLFSHMLGEGEASRLEHIVKEERGLVNSIHSYAFSPLQPGLFIIQAHLPQKKDCGVLDAIFNEIGHFLSPVVPEEDFKRAKLNIRSSIYYEKETCEGNARKLILYQMNAGDYRYERDYLRKIDQATLKDIQKVVREYFSYERSSLVILQPQKSPLKLKLPLKVKGRKGERKKYNLVEESHGVVKYKLSNGVTLLVRENHRVPLISLYLTSFGGLRSENRNNNGISQLVSAVISKGTKNKNALKMAEISESIAGHVTPHAGRNTWGLQASFLSEKKESAIDLFTDILLNPLFEEEELAKEKKLLCEAIRNQEDSPGYLAFKKFLSLLYKKHPYGLPSMGTIKSLRLLTKNKLLQFYKRHLDPQRMVISAVGDCKPADMAETFSDILGTLSHSLLKKEKRGILRIHPEDRPLSIRKGEVKKKKEQAHIVLGYLGTTVKHADRYPFEVLNNILSGQGGRLFLKLRDEASLAYSVSSTLVEGIEPGYFAVHMGAEPSKVDACISGILRELKKITDETIGMDELLRAKNYIIGNHQIDLQRNLAFASTLAVNELYGIGYQEFKNFSDKIEAVTADQVLRTAQKYFKLSAYTLAVVKP